jgi:hypothetical protein
MKLNIQFLLIISLMLLKLVHCDNNNRNRNKNVKFNGLPLGIIYEKDSFTEDIRELVYKAFKNVNNDVDSSSTKWSVKVDTTEVNSNKYFIYQLENFTYFVLFFFCYFSYKVIIKWFNRFVNK